MTTGGDESRISLNGFLEVKELGAGKGWNSELWICLLTTTPQAGGENQSRSLGVATNQTNLIEVKVEVNQVHSIFNLG
jgi:hypothetical protein